MLPETWVVLLTFIVFAIYFLIMSIVSKFYQDWLSAKWGGRWVNFAWMMALIIGVTVLMFFNVECTVKGDCRYMAITLACAAVLFTIINIVWGVVHTINYKKREDENVVAAVKAA